MSTLRSAIAYRSDIDGLRAFAILAVIGFHTFPTYVAGGFVGVDIFFVISGFLISGIILSEQDHGLFSFMRFYQRRILRIFPPLMVILLVCAVVGWQVFTHTEYRDLAHQIKASAFFFNNVVLWREASYFDHAAISKPLNHLWSLSVEEQFYVAWPLCLWLVCKWRRGLPVFLVCALLLSFGMNLWLVLHHEQTAAFYWIVARGWELAAGGLLASAQYQGWVAIRNPRWLAIVGGMLMAAGAFYPIPQHQFPGLWALVPVLGACAVIAAGPQAWFNRRVCSHRLMVGIGQISYPLYLWHWVLLSFSSILWPFTPVLYGTGIIELALYQTGIINLSMVLAWMSTRWIETPMRAPGQRTLKAAICAAMMVGLGVAGHVIVEHNGLEERFPAMLRGFLDYKPDLVRDWRRGACFLDTKDAASAFQDCSSHPANPHAPAMVLWGDSMSASLYPGYQKRYANRYRLIQHGASHCPPILGFDPPGNPNCKQINDFVLARIQHDKPERVVLVGAWHIFWQDVDSTVAALKAAGVKHIDITGTAPEWKGDLPRVVYRYYRDNPDKPIPYRLADDRYVGLYREIDRSIQLYAKQAGIRYLPIADLLCHNPQGCLVRIGDAPDQLIAWTSHHFTPKGAQYLVSLFPD